MKKFAIAALLLLPWCAFAQAPQSPQDEAAAMKRLQESIDNEVERYEITFKLEDWQVFYVDSIFNYNFHHRAEELTELSKTKVTNEDVYYMVDDKWMEANYQALQKVFNEKQWSQYLKMGAAKEKKSRDKRAAKRSEQ
ncbi:MAG: hypothetical protein MJY89_06505 [Bacteroidales bacterium]|nr:hypothetical protein [Bacteroidales bacterium]